MSNSSNSRVGQYLGCIVLVDGYTQELTEQESCKERIGRTVATIYTCHSSQYVAV
jgi:hypothetical protein